MRWRRALAGWLTGTLVMAGLAAAQSAPAADRIDLIRARGALVVGVKGEYPPFGMRDSDGKLVGLEPELAADLAARLNVGLRLVEVNSANRLQKLADGSVDVLIATLGDTSKRRQMATMIEPNYYASGVNIMMPAARQVSSWAELRGQTVCTAQGAYFNRPMSQRYLLDLQTYNSPRDAQLALKEGRCAGWLYDDTAIAAELKLPEWRNYTMPLNSMLLSPWAIAIRQGDDGAALERAIGDAIAEWHRSGTLIELERKWQMPASAFLRDAGQLWSQRDAAGNFVCTRLADGGWPDKCRDQSRRTGESLTPLEQWGMHVNELTGLDFSIVYDAYDRNAFLRGLLISLALAGACVLGSALFAALIALVLDARIPVVSRLVAGLATFGRMTPPLLQLYVVVFGLGSIVAGLGFTLNAFAAAAFCLSVYAGSACAVALIEAADLIRHHEPDFRIGLRTLPRVFGRAYQPVMAALVNIVKATGMASVVAVPELISSSTSIIAERGNSTVMMNVLMVAYFLMVLLVMRLIDQFHKRMVKHVAA